MFKLKRNCRKVFKLITSLILFIIVILYFSKFDFDDTQLFRLKLNKIDMNKFSQLKSKCSCRNEKIQIIRDDLNNHYFFNIHGNQIMQSYQIEISEFESSIVTCDAYSVIRRGTNQKVISYSIYGNESFYFRYLELITRTAKKFYPEFTIRFYHDNNFNKTLMCELECLRENSNSGILLDNVDFCNVNDLPLIDFNIDFMIERLWRWLPSGDDFVDLFLSRDSDFCIVEREHDAVFEWLEKNTVFHIIRDHPDHNLFMLAGLWGFFTSKSRDNSIYLFNRITHPTMKRWYDTYRGLKQADQIFLEKYLWNIVKKNVTAHDSFYCDKFGGIPFPTRRPDSFYCHVGGYGCCGPEYSNASFPHECNESCRPKKHKEWIFC